MAWNLYSCICTIYSILYIYVLWWNSGQKLYSLGSAAGAPRNSWPLKIKSWAGPSVTHRGKKKSSSKTFWLVVSTPLKNISQLGLFFPIYGKIKNVPNHQPAFSMDTNLYIASQSSEVFLWNIPTSHGSRNSSPWHTAAPSKCLLHWWGPQRRYRLHVELSWAKKGAEKLKLCIRW